MSGIPDEIPEYGDSQLKPRQNPEFSPGRDFGTQDYYVWSRCDGASSLRDIILMTGLGTVKTIGILSKLRTIGAVLLPGEARLPPLVEAQALAIKQAAMAPLVALAEEEEALPVLQIPVQPQNAGASAKREAEVVIFEPAEPTQNVAAKDELPELSEEPEAEVLVLENPTAQETAALAAEVDLSASDKTQILVYRRRVAHCNYFELLGVEADADKRSIKRAYFRLSKEFHPDRYYGKQLGEFAPWLSDTFKAISDAFKILGNVKKRAKYVVSLQGGAGQDLPQTKQEHAAALFQNACELELQGELGQALKLFAACIRMEENAKYMKRAAMCALQARELSVAEEYAKKAAHLCERDASYLRVLSDVYRDSSQWKNAKEILEQALKLNVENDKLYGELQSDLAEVDAVLAKAVK